MADADGNLRAQTTDRPYVFEVPAWRADRIAPSREDTEVESQEN